jgi:holliday junction DNA helicase RuvA
MIAYLEGRLLKKDDDRVILLANQVGYEVLLPTFVHQTLHDKSAGDEIAFYIYFHQTERQPKPVLIGFNLEAEKEFFQHFITVEAIGPLKAARALSIAVRDIARAIETNDLERLKQLKGIGLRSAQKIIATLQGKVGKFTLIRETQMPDQPEPADFTQPVMDVLVGQLGHKPAEARYLIVMAQKRNSTITTPEALFEEVYRGEKGSVK